MKRPPDNTEVRLAFRTLLKSMGEDPNREGLLDTPERARKAWADWTSGYHQDPGGVLKSFEDGAEGCNEMIVLDSIPVQSHCEHHLAPFVGTAVIGYVPDGRIVGLSKLPRLVNVFAKRLQVQERLTTQVADALMAHLKPKGCGVVIRAEHFCMATRGVHTPGVFTTTSALRGLFLEEKARNEFLALARR
jgi:GTP cyclohydrolase IA